MRALRHLRDRCPPAPPCSRPAPAPARPNHRRPGHPLRRRGRGARSTQLLVVTFGRAASQELRERVRAQLVEAERALADAGGGAEPPRSELLDLLLAGDDARGRRCGTAGCATRWPASTRRPSRPPTSSASWCWLARAWPATPTPAPRWSRPSTTWWSRWSTTSTCARSPGRDRPPVFDRADARWRSPRQAIDDPQAQLEPPDEDPAERRPAGGSRSRAGCAPRSTGASAGSASSATTTCSAGWPTRSTPTTRRPATRMRQRWRIVLVDEFQDTDPVQWQVLDRAFSGHATMVLIGDPKQAIYAFRGGDVVTYLAAAATADQPADARRQLAQRRRRWSTRSRCVLARRRSSATRGSWSHASARTTPAAGCSARRSAAPFRLRVVRRDELGTPRHRAAHGRRRCAPHIAARPRRRHRARCSPPARTFDGRAAAGRATSR